MHSIGQSIKSPECPCVRACVLLYLSSFHLPFHFFPFPIFLSLNLLHPLFLPLSLALFSSLFSFLFLFPLPSLSFSYRPYCGSDTREFDAKRIFIKIITQEFGPLKYTGTLYSVARSLESVVGRYVNSELGFRINFFLGNEDVTDALRT